MKIFLALVIVGLLAYFYTQEFVIPITPSSPCPRLSDHQYPVVSDATEALFQQARTQEKQEEAKYFKDRDYSEVVRLYSLAASQGHWKAMNNLGILYDVGYFIPEDKRKARALFQSMVDMGVPEGYVNMAEYKSGHQSRRYLRKAAELGHARSQFIYAISLYKTRKPKNIEIADQWLQCAYEGKYADAAFYLALNEKDKNNMAQAYHYYKQGAILGSGMCVRAMRKIYDQGLYGKKKDLERAECFKKLDYLLDEDPNRTFPNIDELCPPSSSKDKNK